MPLTLNRDLRACLIVLWGGGNLVFGRYRPYCAVSRNTFFWKSGRGNGVADTGELLSASFHTIQFFFHSLNSTFYLALMQ